MHRSHDHGPDYHGSTIGQKAECCNYTSGRQHEEKVKGWNRASFYRFLDNGNQNRLLNQVTPLTEQTNDFCIHLWHSKRPALMQAT